VDIKAELLMAYFAASLVSNVVIGGTFFYNQELTLSKNLNYLIVFSLFCVLVFCCAISYMRSYALRKFIECGNCKFSPPCWNIIHLNISNLLQRPKLLDSVIN
jgi:hypothetical protein